MRHSIFQIWGSSIRILLREFENGQKVHLGRVVEQYCFGECGVNFAAILLGNKSEAFCHLQWVAVYSIASSTWLSQMQFFRGFWIMIYDVPFNTHVFHLPMQGLQHRWYPVFHIHWIFIVNLSRLCPGLSRIDRGLPRPPSDIEEMITFTLSQNTTFPDYLKLWLDSLRQTSIVSLNELDERRNVVAFAVGGLLLNDHQMKVLRSSCQPQKLP
jgi:hypothetical protein